MNKFDDDSTVVTTTTTTTTLCQQPGAKLKKKKEEEKEEENLMKIMAESSRTDDLPKGDKADPAEAKKPNKEADQQRKADLLEADLSSSYPASTAPTSTPGKSGGESKESLQGLKSIILTEHKNVASFVVIGETLDRLYYKDKLVKNQKEFLEWTKINLGFSKSTTYEYIISYRVGTRL